MSPSYSSLLLVLEAIEISFIKMLMINLRTWMTERWNPHPNCGCSCPSEWNPNEGQLLKELESILFKVDRVNLKLQNSPILLHVKHGMVKFEHPSPSECVQFGLERSWWHLTGTGWMCVTSIQSQSKKINLNNKGFIWWLTSN